MRRNTLHPAIQRFRVSLPFSTHRDPASCQDVDCTHYLGGWITIVGVGSEQEDYIRRLSGRKFSVKKQEGSTTILEFTFESGQRCFQEHTVLNGREPYYLHETAQGRRVHTPEGFMEHAHQEIEKNIGLEDRRNG